MIVARGLPFDLPAECKNTGRKYMFVLTKYFDMKELF